MGENLTTGWGQPASGLGGDPVSEIRSALPEMALTVQPTRDDIPTIWCGLDQVERLLRYLKDEVHLPYDMLFDLTLVDERERKNRDSMPMADFTLVYTLMSVHRNSDIRVKVLLTGEYPSVPTVTHLWPNANWYEREAWDMFGIRFDGHPHLRRILLPTTWKGHPLRKEFPARATEHEPYSLPDEKWIEEEEALRFNPDEWGLSRGREDTDYLFLNLGPQHLGTHGLLRLILQLDGEQVLNVVPDIGFHHRGAEKMAERQTWHSYIPYTDRIDYLGGVMNNLPYVLTVEKLAGIEVPDRVKVIRVMLAELFRIASHLIWFGTQAQDVGQLSPVFYCFADRERVFAIIEAICGGRMHPSWYRIGGVAQDLPRGWDKLVREFLDFMPARLADYHKMTMKNGIFRARMKGIGDFNREEAIAWGQTGPGLRATGLPYDLRKMRPYSGYENFEFDVPTATAGDCFARAEVRLEEIAQSLRIVRQCVDNMPEGPYKADHPLAMPPRKDKTLQDIETLITHFVGVAWGPVIPAGEASVPIEATKGINSYYLISDHDTSAYRCRIRTPSFPHMQMVPLLCQGTLVPDVLTILGAVDFVLADIDR